MFKDKYQTQFCIDGELAILTKNQSKFADIPISDLLTYEKTWFCPFCLTESNMFTLESGELIKCPNCQNRMRKKTMLFIKECTNQEFARWIYGYRQNGFFQKVKPSFSEWNQKLYSLGMSKEVWDEYKKLKGEDKDESEWH